MSNLKDLRFAVCSYKIKPNSLSNLKIKINLSKVSSFFQIEENANALNYSEEYTFSWQEKVFSPSERKKYSNSIPNPTIVEEKYIREVKDKCNNFPTRRLFSYVEHDNYLQTQKVFTTKNENTVSYVGEVLEKSTGPKVIEIDSWKSGVKMNPLKERVEDEENFAARFLPQSNCRHMFIMADLGYPVKIKNKKTGNGTDKGDTEEDDDADSVHNKTWVPQEVLLCRLSVNDNNGTIIFQPKFNNNLEKSYFVENPDTNENFEYSIMNVSATIPNVEKEKEVKLLKELYARSASRILSLVGSNFEEPDPDGALRLFVTGEIYCAYNFEHQNIYIQYFVDIPDDWNVTNLEELTGITQISRGKVVESGYLSYFSFPLEFNMTYKKNFYLTNDEYDLPPKWPMIYLEVFGVDSWSRFRTEGYGYAQLPNKPGIHKIDISCWRPLSDSITNELRRFFVGGSAELEDLTFTAVPATFEGSLLSKYGFRTMSTGNVVLKLNCLQQSSIFIDEKLKKENSSNLVNRLGVSNVHFGVMEVIKRFQRAKNKLIKVQQSYVEDDRLLNSAIV